MLSIDASLQGQDSGREHDRQRRYPLGVGMVRNRRRRNPCGPVVAAILVVGLVSGCAGADEPGSSSDDESPAPTETDAADDTDSSTDTDDGDPENGDDTDEGLAWVPFGPSDPTIPTPSWPVYNAFAQGRCEELQDYLETEDIGDFGRAMVALRAAAFDGREDQWEVAEALSGADSASLANDCLADVVKDLIDRALAWHDEHPGRTPAVKFQRVQGKTECGEQAEDEEFPPETEEPSPETEKPPPETESPPETTEPTEPAE